MDTKGNDPGAVDDATIGSRADSVGGTPMGAMPGVVDAGIEESYWRESWRSRPYFSDDYTFADFAPAYRNGWEAWSTYGSAGKRFEDVEPQLRSDWERTRGSSRLGWEKAKLAVRDAWDRVRQGLGVAGSSPAHRGDDAGLRAGSLTSGVGATGAVRDADAYGTNAGTTSVGGASASASGSGSSLAAGGTSLGGGSSGAGMGGSGSGMATGTGATPGAPASFGASGSLGGGAMGAGSASGSSIEGAGGASIVRGAGGIAPAKGGLGTGGVANDATGYRSGDGFNYGYAGTPTSTPDAIERGAVDDAGRGDGHDRDLRILNSYLRGEISACETYRQAIGRLGAAYPQLADGLSSHERRMALLKDRIRSLGGEPSTGSGLWGAWAKLVQMGADLFGERSAIAALESGEDHGRNDYRRELPNLSAALRTWVESALLPEEERTHAMLSDLKHAHA